MSRSVLQSKYTLPLTLTHRAQPGGKLGSILNSRKRKITDYQSSNTNAASTLPGLAEDREDLAWVMCVLLMATRQLALVNKTGQVNFEINVVCRMFVEWIRNIIQQHFMPFFSSMLFLSYDRVIAGYLTRQVATTFMATCARHYAESESATEANAQILLDMESAPVTLHTCNLAICNAITHMVDTNLILVNQIIRDKLQTPVVPINFLVAILTGESVDMSSSNYEQIFSWMSQVVQNRNNEVECVMGYLSVAKLGTMEDYNSKEAFLESNFGVAKSNYYTYLTAIRECCSKTFDLTNFLSMDLSMLDFTRFMSRLGVGGDGMLQGYQQQNPLMDNSRTTYLFMQAAQDNAAQPQQRAGIGKSWVNIIQHLLVTSIQGTKDLHADNMFLFGANLTEFILSRCSPIQSIPAGVVVYESYVHAHEEVVPLHTRVGNRPQYFVRTINDNSAMVNGEASELPAVLGPHPPEDVMHLGSWIQLYTILHNGTKPEAFEYIPEYNGRPPELVLNRRYPLVGDNRIGALILHSTGTAVVSLSTDTDHWQVLPPFDLKKWWKFICDKELMTGPLVFRNHAVFSPDVANTPLWVSMRFREEGQFLNQTGEYLLARSEHETETISFLDAHARLLPLGTHLVVRSQAVDPYGLTCTAEWVLGCLRYPEADMVEEEQLLKVCVLIRLKETPTCDGGATIVAVSPLDCRIPPVDRRNVCSYAIKMNSS